MYKKFLVFAIIVCTIHTSSATPCNVRQFPSGSVCVCNETYCDELDHQEAYNGNMVIVSSSKAGLRFGVTYLPYKPKKNENGNDTGTVGIAYVGDQAGQEGLDKTIYSLADQFPISASITVNREKKFQTVIGFGGAFTGTVSHLLSQLPDTVQNFLYSSYYSPNKGIGFNMMRIPIGGCDYDLAPWAYNEQPANDVKLTNFIKLDQRDLDRISQIRKLQQVTANYAIKLIGAAWSPPPWMKNNNAWSGFSALKAEYYQTWAQYHLKYLELMAAQDMHFWGISTGNEPLNGVIGFLFVHFMSLGWTAPKQGIWVGDHLGPLIRNSSFSHVKLFGSDDQRYVYPWWFQQMEQAHSESVKYLDGFAVHWYWDAIAPPRLLDDTHQLYSNKMILNTESCIGDKPWQVHGPVIGSWERAEQYICAYIEDLEHWVNGWVDWNLILDESGGPNYSNNYVDAPVIANIGKKEFYKQPMFYAIGHFSRFVVPNSIRLQVKSTHNDVLAIGFERPDTSVVLIIYNKSIRRANVNFVDGNRRFVYSIPSKSIHTILYV